MDRSQETWLTILEEQAKRSSADAKESESVGGTDQVILRRDWCFRGRRSVRGILCGIGVKGSRTVKDFCNQVGFLDVCWEGDLGLGQDFLEVNDLQRFSGDK